MSKAYLKNNQSQRKSTEKVPQGLILFVTIESLVKNERIAVRPNRRR